MVLVLDDQNFVQTLGKTETLWWSSGGLVGRYDVALCSRIKGSGKTELQLRIGWAIRKLFLPAKSRPD